MGVSNVKNLVIFLIVVVLLGAAAKQFSKRSSPAEIIVKPVYAETRIDMPIGGSSMKGVMLQKTADHEDCQKQIKAIEHSLTSQAGACPVCKLESSVCKDELEPRYAAVFDNKPVSVTYLSLARGNASEREVRLIYWGVTVEQSDALCKAVPMYETWRKGAVTCVHAAR